LWCKLADFYLLSGLFERARDIYEEGIASVITVRDFTTIFDSYAQFEESVLSVKMAELEDDEDEENDDDDDDDDADVDGNDVDLRLARLEHLMERRPLLLSSVLLRQNPHNVAEWLKRVELYKESGDLGQVIRCYATAVKTIDPQLATGKPHVLWLNFASFYEEHGDANNARNILGKAVESNFKMVEDLAHVWCHWGEMELRLAESEEDPEEAAAGYQAALEVMQRAVAEPSAEMVRARALESSGRGKASNITVQERVHKSTKVFLLFFLCSFLSHSINICSNNIYRVSSC
jgi:pre-mRNA-splicing factor SYF1